MTEDASTNYLPSLWHVESTMVLLCMTATVVAAVERYETLHHPSGDDSFDEPKQPTLDSPAVGKPISHSQLVRIARSLQDGLKHGQNHDRIPGEPDEDPRPGDAYRLSALLRGCTFYTPPSAPKPEQSSEYKALMARLRAEEEARNYERMLNPPAPSTQSFYERFPQARETHSTKDDADEVTYQDIDRQLAVIINVLVSVIACSIAVWIAARHWRVETRLALSFGSSLLVAVAEVAVYAGYIRRVSEAKGREKKKIEKKEIVDTWVTEPRPRIKKEPQLIGEVLGQDHRDNVRLRKGKIKA